MNFGQAAYNPFDGSFADGLNVSLIIRNQRKIKSSNFLTVVVKRG
jgi:hypothetical protein